MHSPLEKKFNEYIGSIHALLRDDSFSTRAPQFVNQLLDRLEHIQRTFTILQAEKEDVFTYQEYLSRLVNTTNQTLEWVGSNADKLPSEANITSLKENIFLMCDMFETSKNLMKSFYPII